MKIIIVDMLQRWGKRLLKKNPSIGYNVVGERVQVYTAQMEKDLAFQITALADRHSGGAKS